MMKRLLLACVAFLALAPCAHGNLSFDLTGASTSAGGSLLFTDTFGGMTFTLTVSSISGTVTNGVLGIGVTSGGGNSLFVDNGEQVTFTVTPVTNVSLTSLEGTIFNGTFTNGTDTFSSLPGTITTNTFSATFTPSGTGDTAVFTTLNASFSAVPEPSGLALAGFLAIPVLRRRRRRT